jgi:hypothetical protein
MRLYGRNYYRVEGPLTKLRRAASELSRAEARTEKARQALHDAIREAHAAGESAALIAEVAGITRARVYQVVKED